MPALVLILLLTFIIYSWIRADNITKVIERSRIKYAPGKGWRIEFRIKADDILPKKEGSEQDAH